MQASQLDNLHNQWLDEGVTELSFLIVNSKIWHAQLTFQMLKSKVSFPVYQETYTESVWNVLEGGKDDMFVYDRCGRLVEYIPFPRSILSRDDVKNAVWNAYFNDPCGPCPKLPAAEVTTVSWSKDDNITEIPAIFNSSGQCYFNLEQCITILSDSQLASCCATMGDNSKDQESMSCDNQTDYSCDKLHLAEDCCKVIKQEECKQYNKTSCYELLDDHQSNECCDQMQVTNITSDDCLNTTSSFCNEYKHGKLCCMNVIMEKDPSASYNYSCIDYDEVKCSSLEEEQNLIRCCVNNGNNSEEIEDMNYEAICHNVTKISCSTVAFALDCCKQIKEDGQFLNISQNSLGNRNYSDHYHKHHHHVHHNTHHKHKEDDYPQVHKHRHHHGEKNHNQNKKDDSSKDHHHDDNHITNMCLNYSPQKCYNMRSMIKRYHRCCTVSNPPMNRCRSILLQCDEVAEAKQCCKNVSLVDNLNQNKQILSEVREENSEDKVLHK